MADDAPTPFELLTEAKSLLRSALDRDEYNARTPLAPLAAQLDVPRGPGRPKGPSFKTLEKADAASRAARTARIAHLRRLVDQLRTVEALQLETDKLDALIEAFGLVPRDALQRELAQQRADEKRERQRAAARAGDEAAAPPEHPLHQPKQLSGFIKRLNEFAKDFRETHEVAFAEAETLAKERATYLANAANGLFPLPDKLPAAIKAERAAFSEGATEFRATARMSKLMRALMEAYKDFLVEELKLQHDATQTYHCYRDGRIYVDRPADILLFGATLDPLARALPRVYVVDPDVMFPHMAGQWPCPDCCDDVDLEPHQRGHLVRHDWGTWHYVQALPSPYVVLAKTFQDAKRRRGPGCGCNVSAISPRFLDATPEGAYLRSTLPATFSHLNGVDRVFADLQDVATKLAFSDFQKIAEKLQALDYDRARLGALAYREIVIGRDLARSQRPHYFDELKLADVPPVDDPRALLLPIATAGYFTDQWLKRARLTEIDRHQFFSMIPATNVAWDGAFKFPGTVYHFTCGVSHIYVMVQEDGLIRYLRMAESKAQDTFLDELKNLVASAKARGYPEIQVVYLDDMHHLASFFADNGPESIRGRPVAPIPEALQARLTGLASLFGDAERRYVRVTADDDRAVELDELFDRICAAPLCACDSEWRSKPAADGVDVLQIGIDGLLVAIQIARGVERPARLRAFLEDGSLRKIFFSAGTEKSLIKEHWAIDVVCEDFLATLREDVRISGRQALSLYDVVLMFLGVELVKDERLQRADWAVPIDEWRLIYAHADVYFLLEAVKAYEDGTGGGTCLPDTSAAPAGTFVRYQPLRSGWPVLYGAVIQDGVRSASSANVYVAHEVLDSASDAVKSEVRRKKRLTTDAVHVRVLAVPNRDVKAGGYGQPLREFGDGEYSLVLARDHLRRHRGPLPATGSAEVENAPPLSATPAAGERMQVEGDDARRRPRYGLDVDGDEVDVSVEEIAECERISAGVGTSNARRPQEGTGPLPTPPASRQPGDPFDFDSATQSRDLDGDPEGGSSDVEQAHEPDGDEPRAPTPSSSAKKGKRKAKRGAKGKNGDEDKPPRDPFDASLDRPAYDGMRGDVLHSLKDFGPSERCLLKRKFRYELSLAVFTPYAGDHDLLDGIIKMLNPRHSADYMREYYTHEYYSLVRCIVERSEIVWPRVEKVLKKYQLAQDKNGVCLFSGATTGDFSAWARPCEDLRTDVLSDKYGVVIFEVTGLHSKYGLPTYRRIRGTPRVERVNREMHEQFGGSGHRGEILHHRGIGFATSYNVERLAGQFLPTRQHGDISLMYLVDAACHRAFSASAYGPWFVNGSFWPPTKERHGLSPLATSYISRYNIERGTPRLVPDHAQFHLTRLYGTSLPVAPIQPANTDALLNVFAGFRDKGTQPLDQQIAYSLPEHRDERKALVQWATALARRGNGIFHGQIARAFNTETRRLLDAGFDSARLQFLVPVFVAQFLAKLGTSVDIGVSLGKAGLAPDRRARQSVTEAEPAVRQGGPLQPQGGEEPSPPEPGEADRNPFFGRKRLLGDQTHDRAAKRADRRAERAADAAALDAACAAPRHCFTCAWLMASLESEGKPVETRIGHPFAIHTCDGNGGHGTCPHLGWAITLGQDEKYRSAQGAEKSVRRKAAKQREGFLTKFKAAGRCC